jgi:tetratricopeptide (TPR) repeat protein
MVWAGGGVTGVVLGALTYFGLAWAGVGQGSRTAERAADGSGPETTSPTANAVADMSRALRYGDLEGAAKAGIENDPSSDPEKLVLRGKYRWLKYLQAQTRAGAAPKADAPAVQEAVADLTRAGNNADALLWLGLIQEMTNQTKEAKDTYTRAQEAFKDDPAHRRMFQAALNRLRTRGPIAPPSGAARRGPAPGDVPAEIAVLLAVALQQPPPAGDQPKPPPRAPRGGADEKKGRPAPTPEQPPKEGDEAGYDFWAALDLARERKFEGPGGAIALLRRARKVHEQQRGLRFGQAQNPTSDPSEDIFLRCCDQMIELWSAEEALDKGKEYTGGATRPALAVDVLIRKVQKDAEAVKAAQAEAEKLAAEHKADLEKAAELDKMLKAARADVDERDKQLKAARADVEDRERKLKAARADEAKLRDEMETQSKTLDRVRSALVAARWMDPRAGAAGIPGALADALRMAAVNDPEGTLRRLDAQVRRDEEELRRRRRPEELLPRWLTLLDQNRDRHDLAAQAQEDAARVSSDPGTSPADRARGQVVLGLALRNEGQFAEARAALEKGLAGLRGDRDPFRRAAEEALRQVSAPGVWLASQARQQLEEGRTTEALALLNQALEALPEAQHPPLLAQRCLLELELARAKARGPLNPADPLLVSARRDAAAAARAGLAEGHYAAGKVAETLGRFGEAARDFRAAVDAHQAMDEASARYRVALARLLARPREGAAPAPPPAKEKDEGDKAAQLSLPADAACCDDLGQFLSLFSVAVQIPGEAPLTPQQQEAQRLAQEVLDAPPGKVSFEVRAQALAILGRWTEALLTYAEGLRRRCPGPFADELVVLVRNHPRLGPPAPPPGAVDPLEAERDYALGLNFYFDGNYARAVQAFQDAVEHDDQDARYHFFLGLALEALGRPEANEAFSRGAALERLGRPAPAVIDAALERVQGPARRALNRARSEPR